MPRQAVLVAIGMAIITAILLVIVAGRLYSKEPDVAEPLWGESATIGLQDAVQVTLETYYQFVTLGTLLFAAVGFLLSYRQQQGNQFPPQALLPLVASLVLAAGAILFALLGMDRILVMVSNNAVDLTFESLRQARGFMYLTWALALLALVVFVLVVFSHKPHNAGHAADD